MLKKLLLSAGLILSSSVYAETSILNASYDVTREFYKEYNEAFAKYWKDKTGEVVTINQSHGGSSKQARSVIEGLEADVVTFNQNSDIDVIADSGKISKEWTKKYPNNSSPTLSTTVFLVRKGNPKKIRDWNDLLRDNVASIIPNPKTSGNGRYTYLAAWGSVIKKGGDDTKAKEFVTKLFKKVPVLDTGGRGASTTFVQRGIGDVLITFENEVFLIKKESGTDDFDVVYPSVSILAENPVSVVDKVVDKRNTRKVSEAYLNYLYSDEGQEIAVHHHLRPTVKSIADKHKNEFKQVDIFTVDELFDGWKNAQKVHFADGGTFDQIYTK